jgi:hypothetical protein
MRHITSLLLIALCAASCFAQDAPPTLIPDWWARQAVVPIPRAYPQAPIIDGNIGYGEWYNAANVCVLG